MSQLTSMIIGTAHSAWVGFFMCFGFGAFFLNLMTILDILRRSWYRLEVFECLKAGRSLSPINTIPLRLIELETESQVTTYKNHDGSFASFVKLFLTEFKLSYQWREILFYSEIVHILAFNSFSMPLYIGTYIAQYGSMTLWLNQIHLQVNDCINTLINTLKISDDNATRISQNEANKNNIRLLMLAYLNFELFRRKQKAYQSLTNFLLLQMILMNLPLMVMTYLALASFRENDKIIMFIMLCYTFLNLYLITSAVRTNSVLKLMKDMSRLFAYIAENHLEQTMVARPGRCRYSTTTKR